MFDAMGTAIAASQTVIPELGPRGNTDVVFTWNAPFGASVGRVEILPRP